MSDTQHRRGSLRLALARGSRGLDVHFQQNRRPAALLIHLTAVGDLRAHPVLAGFCECRRRGGFAGIGPRLQKHLCDFRIGRDRRSRRRELQRVGSRSRGSGETLIGGQYFDASAREGLDC